MYVYYMYKEKKDIKDCKYFINVIMSFNFVAHSAKRVKESNYALDYN